MPDRTTRFEKVVRWFVGRVPCARGDGRALVRAGGVFGAGVICAGMLSACAGGSEPIGSSISGRGGTQTAVADEDAGCARLSGRMQVRILQIRDYTPVNKTSGLSRGLHGLSTSLVGGSVAGVDPDARYNRDVAKLRSQNEMLRKQGCKTYDLDAELRNKDVSHTPTPR